VFVSILLLSVITGQARSDGPKLSRPQAVYVLCHPEFSPLTNPTAVRLAATPSTVVVLSETYDSERVVAFDRRTGSELWTVPGDPDSNAEREDGRAGWTLVGVAVSPTGREVVVLRRSAKGKELRTSTADSERPYGALIGADAHSGKRLWQVALPTPAVHQAAASVSLVRAVVVLTSQTKPASRARDEWSAIAVDAFTGSPVQRPLPGWSMALVQTLAFRPVILSLETLRCVTLPIFSTSGMGPSGVPVASTSTRALVLVTTDDDGAGHSVWPKYLYCADPSGKRAWEYPQTLVFPGSSEAGAWKSYESVIRAEYVPRVGVVILESSRGHLVGAAMQSGRAMWRRPIGDKQVLSMAACDEGCFILFGSASPFQPDREDNWIGLVSARTGKLRRIARVPDACRLWFDGSDLFALVVPSSVSGASGGSRAFAGRLSVQCYRVGDLVTTVSHRQLRRAPRRDNER
jgi:outer membrane protein assembly factor BamB